MKLLPFFILLTTLSLAQTSPRSAITDSLNNARSIDEGVFNLYVKKPEMEIITGVYRNRQSTAEDFIPMTFTYNIYLPFQYDLNYVHLAAKEKIMKINTVLVVHISKYGNYALGCAPRFSFLLIKNTYLSYQAGLAWCEPVKRNTNDGINYIGFCFHHEFSLRCSLTKNIKLSANAIHLSNGNIFKKVKNNQDVLGLGIGYQF